VTYLTVLCAVVIMGVALSAVGQQWSVAMKRDREAELFFRGNRIKLAIETYAADYEVNRASRVNRYPFNPLNPINPLNPLGGGTASGLAGSTSGVPSPMGQ
jgi:type II secretory pathway pseudopilin PulG